MELEADRPARLVTVRVQDQTSGTFAERDVLWSSSHLVKHRASLALRRKESIVEVDFVVKFV